MKTTITGCIAWGLVLLTTPVLVGDAEAQTAAKSSVLTMAKLGLGPMPGLAVMEPLEMEQFDDAIAEYAWPTPRAREWPIDIGDRPIVETRRRDELRHTVESWESLAQIRRRFRTTTARLRELNPDRDLRDLEEGDELVVWRRNDDRISQSRGEPAAGRLVGGEPMPDSDDYVVQFPHRAFGTYYTVSETVRVLDAYYARFPNADPLIVGDLSAANGRSIHPHNSHQSGRDVDLTLPRHEPPPNYRRFHHIRRDNLDADRTLWLLATLIEGGYVEYIFLDWHHQRTLWNLAREQGAPDEWLDEVFQYPSRRRQGLVRHESGHQTHMHIRFSCQETDEYCR